MRPHTCSPAAGMHFSPPAQATAQQHAQQQAQQHVYWLGLVQLLLDVLTALELDKLHQAFVGLEHCVSDRTLQTFAAYLQSKANLLWLAGLSFQVCRQGLQAEVKLHSATLLDVKLTSACRPWQHSFANKAGHHNLGRRAPHQEPAHAKLTSAEDLHSKGNIAKVQSSSWSCMACSPSWIFGIPRCVGCAGYCRD